MNENLLTVNEVAKMLRVSRNTINRWIHEKKISAVRYGKQGSCLILGIYQRDEFGRKS